LAISKLLHINSSKDEPHSRTLEKAINYILNPHKTGEGILTGAVNCKVGSAYERMVMTKKMYGKTDLRQGYHFIISFAPDETDAKTAMEIIEKFVKEYLGERYEAVYAVHENTEVIHGHVVFNSVSFLDGYKYHYDKGDWKRDIQPIVNRLCASYGLSVIDVEKKAETGKLYKDIVTGAGYLGAFKPMIIRDLDAAVILASDFEQFKDELIGRGYEVKCGKYFAIKPPGMKRFCRTKSLGEAYSEAELRRRIQRENLLSVRREKKNPAPTISKYYVGRIRKRTLSSLQKKYFARWYRTGKLKKRPYSQAYKYRNEIKRLKELQEQSLLLLRYNVKDAKDLISLKKRLAEESKRVYNEKKRLYRDRTLFEKLTPDMGYTESEIAELKGQIESNLSLVKKEESKVKAECRALDRVIRDTIVGAARNGIVRDNSEKEYTDETKTPEETTNEKEKDKILEPKKKLRGKEREYVRQR